MALSSEKSPTPTLLSDQSLHLLAPRETWFCPEDTEFPAALMCGSHFLSHVMDRQARSWYRYSSCFSLPLPNHGPFLALPLSCFEADAIRLYLSQIPFAVAPSCPPGHSHTVLGDFNTRFTAFLSSIFLHPSNLMALPFFSLFAVIIFSVTPLQPPNQLSLDPVTYNCTPQLSQFQAYNF